ncbi:signal peptidase II [Coprobacillus sp. 3_3_56FAA]|nr:signal peptidase II [Coprobacillus sp. 3_3_56FAA]
MWLVLDYCIMSVGDKNNEFNKKNKILYLVTLILVVGGDLFTKHLVSSSMLLGQSHEIINNFFYFTYAHNTGVAWGMFAGKLGLFIVVAIIAAVVMIVFFRKTKSEEVLTRFGLVLTFGGMIGNLVDRIFLGYVRDFIDVIIFNYNFPIFNIADMAVVIGVALIIVEIVFEEYIHGKN